MARVIEIEKTGGPEVMVPAERDVGSPGEGQVHVAVEACGVNFIDVYFRSGVYPRPLPFTAGLEGAGTVRAVGPGVDTLHVGQRVAWSSVPGSYASELIAPAAMLVAVPDSVPSDTAAAAMLQGMTAHYLVHGCGALAHGCGALAHGCGALVHDSGTLVHDSGTLVQGSGALGQGDVALVHAAAGGVGLLLIQMLSRAGVRVLGTCSTEEKAALARDAGADAVIRYDSEDFTARARALTDGRGVDIVYDSVGQSTFEGSLASLRPRGLMCLFGQSSGVVPPFDLGRLNGMGSLFVTRPSLAHYTASREELEMRAGAVLGAIAAGDLSVRIGARFALEEAAEAHRALEGRRTTGKVLLTT